MGLIKWLFEKSLESPIHMIVIWLGIGYLNTFIMRFLCRMPCRFDGDDFEESNFWRIFLFGPLSLIAVPVFFTYDVYNFVYITLPYLREQKKIAKMKLLHKDEQETLPPPLHLI
ncbi:MAG: hypothetical protein NTW35_01630 [Candidatus Nomurabacteria bacterium]|nr:hypothetical protein [Candidatus Nomurabacteria bacterium]